MSTFPGPFGTAHVVTSAEWNLARDAVELNESNIATNTADIATNTADIATHESEVNLLQSRVLGTNYADRLYKSNAPIWRGSNMSFPSSVLSNGAIVQQALPGSLADYVVFPFGDIPNGTIINGFYVYVDGPAYTVPTTPLQARLLRVDTFGNVTLVGSAYDSGSGARSVGATLGSPHTAATAGFYYIDVIGAEDGTGTYLFFGASINAR